MKYIITKDQYRLINEEVNPRLKEIIFKKLLNDLKDVEIIEDPENGDIWAIDPEKKYWYFQLKKSGLLWWRWDFFNNFFRVFSMEQKQYEPLIRSMVEDLLNRKVVTSVKTGAKEVEVVEDLLNRKVGTSDGRNSVLKAKVEDLLNRKVGTSYFKWSNNDDLVEDLLNRKVGSSLKEDLAVWFGTKKKPKGSKQPAGPWVNICRKDKDGKHPPCGRSEASDKGYPKCRAAGVAGKMSDSEKKSACQQKRKAEKSHSKSGTGNKPKMTHYEPKNEQLHPIIRRSIRESL